MNALRVVNMVVPEHVVLRHIHSRVAFVAAIHARELDRISNEEDRQIIEDKVMIAIFGEEFGRPSFNVSDGIAGALLASDRRNARQDGGLLADFRQELCVSQIGDIFQHLESASRASGFGVHAPVVSCQYAYLGKSLSRLADLSGMRSRAKWASVLIN